MTTEQSMAEKERELGFMSPLKAATLYRSCTPTNPTFHYKIFCEKCGGWVNWQPTKEECPRCHLLNPEAEALCRGFNSLPPEENKKPVLFPEENHGKKGAPNSKSLSDLPRDLSGSGGGLLVGTSVQPATGGIVSAHSNNKRVRKPD